MFVPGQYGEMKFSYRKAKRKSALTTAQTKKLLQWAKNKYTGTIDDWENVIFSDEARICAGHGDDAGNSFGDEETRLTQTAALRNK